MQLTLRNFLAYSALGVRYRYVIPFNSNIDPMYAGCNYRCKNYSLTRCLCFRRPTDIFRFSCKPR